MAASLSDQKEPPVNSENPKHPVSVIIPARNEEANIESVVRSILAQDFVREIIVIDDGSTDRTGEILARLQSEASMLRTIRVDALPAGWTGKSHAVALGAQAAQGEWLLFTDADTEHLPGSVEAMLKRAQAAGADLLSLSPGQLTITWWEKSVIPYVFVQLARLYRFEQVSDPASPLAAANGQYLLIRRNIYNSAGGHAAVRQEILEDVALAQRVKAAGGKLLFLPGSEWVRTRMYRTFREMWEGWSKNLYLLYGRKTGAMFGTLVRVCLPDFLLPFSLLALCGLIITSVDGSAVLLAAILCFGVALARQWSYGEKLAALGFDRSLASFQILGAGLFAALLLNSARAYRITDAVRWKGRNYPVRETEQDTK